MFTSPPTKPAHPRTRLLTLIAVAALGTGPAAVRAGTDIIVNWDGSGDYITIQAALDAATNGDTIIVMPVSPVPTVPRYAENLAFPPKAITLRSSDPTDPAIVASTIITGNYAGRVIDFDPATPVSATVAGFTIMNGQATYAAAINFGSASPTIEHCRIIDNHASNAGNSVFGGAVVGNGSNAVLRDCQILANAIDTSLDGYGAVFFWEGAPTITRCTIAGNVTHATNIAYAGGLYLYNTTAEVSACRILANTSQGSGYSQGGGLSVSGPATPHIRSCIIAHNDAFGSFSYGGGIRCVSGTTAVLAHCTISHNTAHYGCQLWCTGSGTNVALHDSIVWSTPGLLPPMRIEDSAKLNVAHSNVFDGAEFQWVMTGGVLNWQAGNLDANPLFIAPYGTGVYPWDDYDFHLAAGSPCISAGDPEFAAGPGETDIDGEPRVQGCATDMGADESAFGYAGDLDNNGATTVADYALFTPCVTGPDLPSAPDCPCADLDTDGDVDLVDFAALQSQIG